MSDALSSAFSGGGSLLSSGSGILSSKMGLDVLQGATTGAGILSRLQQGEATATTDFGRAAQYAEDSVNAGVTAQGQADTAMITSDATVQQIMQKAFAEGTGAQLQGQTSAIRGGTSAYMTGLSDVTAALQKATGLNIGAGETAAGAGAGFAYNAGQQTSLKQQLAARLGSGMAAAGASGLDVGAAQAAGGRAIQAAKNTQDVATAQTLMRYGAGMASADTMRAAATQATQAGQTQSDLVNRIGALSGQRSISEGDISAALANQTAAIATPVEQLKGTLGAGLAIASGGVAQAQDYASELNSIVAGQQAKQAAGAQGLMSGLGGLFSIFSRGL
jgi:hypothetical protein